MNISFTEKQEKYISTQVSSGDFQNASEVVRDALRLHELYRNRVLEELRVEITKGWDGPASKRSVKDPVSKKAEPQEMRIAPVVRKVHINESDDEADDLDYWLRQPVSKRAEAVTFLISQYLKPGQRMDKTVVRMHKQA